MKKLIAAGVALVLTIGFYLTPFHAIRQMQKAAKAHDAAALNAYVDYPSVRENLKVSLQGTLSKTLLHNQTDTGMNAFAKMFASAFVNPLIDAMVTPESIALMLQADLPKNMHKDKEGAEPEAATPSTDKEEHDDKLILSHHYSSFNQFVFTAAKPAYPKAVFTFTLSRDGLLGWKLTGIAIPE